MVDARGGINWMEVPQGIARLTVETTISQNGGRPADVRYGDATV